MSLDEYLDTICRELMRLRTRKGNPQHITMSGLKVGVALSQVHLLNTIAHPYWELYLQGNKSTEMCRLVVSDLTLLFCDMLRSNSLRCDAVSRFSTLVVLASEVSKPNCHYISSPLRSKSVK